MKPKETGRTETFVTSRALVSGLWTARLRVRSTVIVAEHFVAYRASAVHSLA